MHTQGITIRTPSNSGGRHPKGSIDLYSVIHRYVSLSTPTLDRLLKRLSLDLKHEGLNWSLYTQPTPGRAAIPPLKFPGYPTIPGVPGIAPTPAKLLFSGTHPNARDVLDWLLTSYIPDLLNTGTVPPPPGPSPKELDRADRREWKKRRKKMTRQEAAANARKHRMY